MDLDRCVLSFILALVHPVSFLDLPLEVLYFPDYKLLLY